MLHASGTDDGAERTFRRFLGRRLSIAAVICLAIVVVVEFALADYARGNAENAAREDINRLRASLQQNLSRDVQLIRGMTGYVRARPDLSPEEFRLIAQDILDSAPAHVRNIALARDLKISHMYPLEGNQKAIGLRYREVPEQWPAVKRAIDEGRIVIAGPVNLVQGGIGLVTRYPIYLRPTREGERKLWGVASTVINFNGLLEQAGFDAFQQNYRLAMVGRDGDVNNEEVVWGDATVSTAEPVVLDVVIPNGSWRILAVPRAGWPTFTSYLPFALIATVAALILYALWVASQFRIARERSTTNLEILGALQRAEEASAAKSTFLAVMSHELRTPLNAIIGFSELLESSPKSSRVWDRAHEYVGDISQSGRFLLSIIDDILDLSRIESGRRNTAIEHVDVVSLMIESANRLRVEFDAKQIALSVAANPEHMVALGDQRAIMQILNNLLTNALKYAGHGATVAVTACLLDDNRVEISVSDNGPGIPEDKLGDIMKPFVQLSSSYAREVGGVGLGLTICQSLARMMDGSLELESVYGEGTVVHLKLPRSPAA